ncbi:non-specific serine/threonine protein kinase [Malassezia sp. CBS 17886]|nr:non-specific serine/threonine protein kinase [Malassezia sp. CBS 17886]
MTGKMEAEAVPAEQRGGWMSFLKSVATFSGDLSKLTAPSFILSPVSLTEYPSYWGEHPEMIAKIQDGQTPEERMAAVLRWFIATLKGQYTARNTSMGSEKKPLNPVLGEYFVGAWPATDAVGETTLVSEQVSHHPPVTAYCLENAATGVSVVGHSGQKTSFNGRSIQVHQVGHAVLRLRRAEGDETYLITLPTLTIDGLWYGSPYIELTDASYIHSSTGLLATITYSGKGYFSGKAHSFSAAVTNKARQVLLEAAGDWAGLSTVRRGTLLPPNDVFWDANKATRREVSVKPLDQMHEYESRRVWKTVAEGIRSGNYDMASRDKSRIENEQRALRKKREADGTPHELTYFDFLEDDPVYAALAAPCRGIAPPREADAGELLRGRPPDVRAYAGHAAIRRLVREHVVPVAAARSAREIGACLPEHAPALAYTDAMALLRDTVVAAPQALDILPDTAPRSEPGRLQTTSLHIYLVVRVSAALARLGAHSCIALSTYPEAQTYSEALVARLREAFSLTMQLLGTVLHLRLESVRATADTRFLLYDALRCATQGLAASHAFASDHALLLPSAVPAAAGAAAGGAAPLVLCAAYTVPELYACAPGAPARMGAPDGVAAYAWTDTDAAPWTLLGAGDVHTRLGAATAACLLFAVARVAAELAAVFPHALDDVVELYARVMVAQWDGEQSAAAAPAAAAHVTQPYAQLLRFEALVPAMRVAYHAALAAHVHRLMAASLTAFFQPLHDPFAVSQAGGSPYASAHAQACVHLVALLQFMLHASASSGDRVVVTSDVRMLAPALVAQLTALTDETHLDRSLQLGCLCLLLLMLHGTDGLGLGPREERALLAYVDDAVAPHAEARETLRPAPREPPRKRACIAEDGSAPASDVTALLYDPQRAAAQCNAVLQRAADAAPEQVAAYDVEELSALVRPGLQHAQRGVRLATGRLLHGIVQAYAALAVDARPAGWPATLAALAALATSVPPTAPAHLQETQIVTLARLGRVQRDEVFGVVATALVRALYLPHTYLRALAYTETAQLAAERRCTTFQLLSLHLGPISTLAADAMHTAPHGIGELSRLLHMSTASFLQATLPHMLPHLLERFVSGPRAETQASIDTVAATLGETVPALCLAHASDIFKHFFLQPDALRAAGMDALLALIGSPNVTLASLLRSRLHEVLGFLVARLGDAARKERALAGLEYVRTLMTAAPSRWRGADLTAFLKDEVLAVLTWLNEELSAVHGKISTARKAAAARSVGELVKLIGAVAARVAPQVLACLASTLEDPELTLPTLQSWLDFVQALRYQDVGPFVGQTAAALLAVWARLHRAEKATAVAILRYAIVENGAELQAYIDDVPSLDSIEHDVPDMARQLRGARRVWHAEDYFRHILERVANDNAAICVQSLQELRVFLRERRDTVEAWTAGNVFHPLVGQCVGVLLLVAGRAEASRADVPALCLECLGMLGAVDPDRLELPAEERFFVLLSNLENADEAVAFALRLLVDLVVPAFRATNDTKHQAALAYVIQELLKYCGFSAALLDGTPSGARAVPERVRRRWDELPEAMLPTLMPLLSSRYVVQRTQHRARAHPIYLHAASFRDWIQAWVLDLMAGVAPGEATALFTMFRSAVRDQDVGIAQYLLPHLVLHTLISGSDAQRSAVLAEINTVLTDQVSPSTPYEAERRLLSAQTMFRLMDHVGHWMRRVRLVQTRSSKRGRLKDALAHVQSVVGNVSPELAAQASLQCNAYARALLNFEYRIRDVVGGGADGAGRAAETRAAGEARSTDDTGDARDAGSGDGAAPPRAPPDAPLQTYYETMHEIYAHLDDPDGMEGISTRVFAPSLEHQIREHESTGRWTDAQSCWEVELQQRPDDAHLHLGLLRCLRSLGHYDTLRTHIRGVLSVHPDWQPLLAPFQVEGACILADWDQVRALVAQSHRVPELAMARALLAMREDNTPAFHTALHDARMQLGRPVLGPGRTSYAHAYDAVTQVHMLRELELIYDAACDARARDALAPSLFARLNATLPSFRTREPVLSLRRSAFLACGGGGTGARGGRGDDAPRDGAAPLAAIGQCWILSAKTARKAGHFQTAYSAVLQARQCGAPFAFVQKAKLLAHNDQVQAALQELTHALPRAPAAADGRAALARANLLRARLVEATARFQQNDIIQQYKACTSLDPDSEKIWYYLGHFYDSPSSSAVGNQMLLQLSVCRFYMKSAQNGTKFLYRTLPRMLTIWLDAGNELADGSAARSAEDVQQAQLQFDKINDMMRKSIRHLTRYQWFAVFPQLVARIVHRNEAVWQVLLEIIAAVVVAYPQQSLWALIAGSHSKDRMRKQRYQRIVERIGAAAERASRDAAHAIRAFERLSSELLALCEFPVGRETALSMQRHFPALQAAVHSAELILPLQTSITVTLPPNNAVDQQHRPFPPSPPTILGFDDTVDVMHSLQKPRKITVHASNGLRYPFLCKPRDDLRKDARLMEFDAMINKLLQSRSESRRRRLYIRTYAVLILNEECGLIEWVPNTVAYRQILAKHYAALEIPLYTSDLKAIMDDARASPKHAGTIFQDRVLARYPPVFHAWFLETFPEPNAWFRARSAYARTAAVMSIVGFVLGLGDRHGDNILFDAGSGDTVHVDLNCLFEKGTTFEVPERVPFRLTHNMMDALGVTGVEGAFRRTAEITMGILRDNKESLMSVLQAMVHDPLGEWLATDRRSRAKNNTERSGASAGARKALKSVSDKLDGKLRRPGLSDEVRHTTKNLVHMLICDATSAQNLGQMYVGWAPYL